MGFLPPAVFLLLITYFIKSKRGARAAAVGAIRLRNEIPGNQWGRPDGFVLASWPIASMIRRHTAAMISPSGVTRFWSGMTQNHGRSTTGRRRDDFKARA